MAARALGGLLAAAAMCRLLPRLLPESLRRAGYQQLRTWNIQLFKGAVSPRFAGFYAWWPWDLFVQALCWWRAGSCLHVDMRQRTCRVSRLPPKPPEALRLVAISDTHLWHPRLYVPEGDVLLHAGDALAEWGHGATELSAFAAWLSSHRHGHKVFVAGNNDGCLSDREGAAHRLLTDSSGLVYLSEERPFALLELANGRRLGVYGAAWSLRPRRRPSKMSHFQLAPDEEAERWQKIPAQVEGSAVDVLITHGPPAGVLDNGLGSIPLREVVEASRPAVHVFGHEHEGYGAHFGENTLFVNAALCNDFFCAVRRPVVIDMY